MLKIIHIQIDIMNLTQTSRFLIILLQTSNFTKHKRITKHCILMHVITLFNIYMFITSQFTVSKYNINSMEERRNFENTKAKMHGTQLLKIHREDRQ